MMAAPDWYQKTSWTEVDKRDFDTRYSRARDPFNKAQYLRIQALCLRDTDSQCLIKEAIGLLNRCVEEFPENPQLPWVYEEIAICYEKLGMIHETVETYKLAVTTQKKFPMYVTNAQILLARFVIANDLKELFSEVEIYLSEVRIHANSLQEKIFYVSGCKAIFEAARGDFENARIHAQECIVAASVTDSGKKPHKQVGLVSESAKQSTFFHEVKNLVSNLEDSKNFNQG